MAVERIELAAELLRLEVRLREIAAELAKVLEELESGTPEATARAREFLERSINPPPLRESKKDRD